MKFQSDAQRESYDDFPQVTYLECNLGVYKKTNFLRSYLRKYSAKKLWNSDPRFSAILSQMGFFFRFWNIVERKL